MKSLDDETMSFGCYRAGQVDGINLFLKENAMSWIPTLVNVLVNFFALGGTAAAVKLAESMVDKCSLTIEEFLKLKDDLQRMPEVAAQVEALQQKPQDSDLQAQLAALLTQKLEQSSTLQKIVIKADRGSVAAQKISGSVSINNTFNND
ncbi:hypothetical protein [Nitrosomonas sp.]|uniref:hypothetical protein n=1 Tax=Nitrosomonas sp. TaxID=42353 RepID=UPI00284B4D23|nr:hypothetical protein [Nitrosomonas sp.]MDR4513813.1 hypothetical protein [Nitrosomonas sp.]